MTMRSISMKGPTYQRLQDYCDAKGLQYGPTVQKWIKDDLDAKGVPEPVIEKLPEPEPEDPEEIPDQHLTF